MFRNRMYRSMDLIVEGIDRGDVSLILNESAAFQSAFNELKGSIDDFIKLIGEVGLEGLKEPYTNLNKLVGEAEQSLQDMPDEWSWEGQIDALKKPSGDSPPETMVSKIALDHDTNVNACKDGVIKIAEYLEQYKQLFNVGSAGLSLTDNFKSVLKVDQFRLAQLVDPDLFMYELVGVEQGTNTEENNKAVKEAWKGLWDDGTGEEKKWTDFTNMMGKLASGVEQLWKDCGKAIETGKPSDDFQNEVPKQGLVKSLLGGLFGSKSPTKIDPQKVMGTKPDDANGLLGMPFENLSALVLGLLEMSGAASDAASGAVEAIDDNQEELTAEQKGKDLRDRLIKGYGEKPADEQDVKGMPKTARAMAALEKMAELDKKELSFKWVKDSHETITGYGESSGFPMSWLEVRAEKVFASGFEHAFEVKGDGPYPEMEELYKVLELEQQEGRYDNDEDKDVKEFKKDEWAGFFGKDGESNMGDGSGQVIGRALEDLGLLKLTESVHLINEGLVEDLIAKVEEYDDIDDKLKKAVLKKLKKQDSIDWIKNKLELQESFRLINRWGVIAGIIKG